MIKFVHYWAWYAITILRVLIVDSHNDMGRRK
jgi:hypothetical protein